MKSIEVCLFVIFKKLNKSSIKKQLGVVDFPLSEYELETSKEDRVIVLKKFRYAMTYFLSI